MKEENQNRITVWESRHINVGNFENVQCGISFSVNKAQDGSNVATIFENATGDSDSLESIQQKIKELLDVKESLIRLASKNHTDFDTVSKIPCDDIKQTALAEKEAERVESNERSARNSLRAKKLLDNLDSDDSIVISSTTDSRPSRSNRARKFFDE